MALLKEFLSKSWKRLGLTVLAGVVLIGVGLNLLLWPDSQVGFYNEGLQAYRTGRAQEAVQLFDRSLAVYKQRSNDSWLERFVYPAPSREYASYAAFHKAKALLMLKKGKPAVEAFKESLRFNPGTGFEELPGYEHLSQDDVQRLTDQSLIVKYDLELLFKNNKQLAQGEGKGEGKPQPGDQDGKKQQPGQQPGDKPGKGNKDAI